MFGFLKRMKIMNSAIKQVIVVRGDLKLGKGKLAGQVAHASVAGYRKIKEQYSKIAEKWEEEGEKKVVVKVGSEKELVMLYQRIKSDIPCALISDAGLTQIKPGTKTCFAIGPWYAEEVDKYTEDLKLM